jgi:uncharacterized membrane protein
MAAIAAGAGEWRAWVPRLTRIALVLVGVSPFLPRLFEGIPGLDAIGRAFESWFAFQCHREPLRSLELFGRVLPVCSRCFAIYAGLGLGALVLRPRLSAWPLRIWVAVAALAMVLDVWTEALEMRPSWAPMRLLSGLLLAYPVGGALVWAARDWAVGDGATQPEK